MPMIQVAFTNTQNLNSNADQHERAPHIIVIINAPPHSDYDFLPPPTVHQTGPKNVIQHACSILQGRPKRVKTTTREKNTQTERSACIAYRPEAAGRVYKLMHLPNCKLPPQPAYILRLVPASASSLTPCHLMPFPTAEGTRQAQRRF